MIDIPFITFHGSKRESKEDLKKIVMESFNIVLTTYGLIERNINFFSTFWENDENKNASDSRWDYVILDEGHKVFPRH